LNRKIRDEGSSHSTGLSYPTGTLAALRLADGGLDQRQVLDLVFRIPTASTMKGPLCHGCQFCLPSADLVAGVRSYPFHAFLPRNISAYRDRGSRLSVTQTSLDLLVLAEWEKNVSALGPVGRYGGWFKRQTLELLLGARLGCRVGLIESSAGTYYESDCVPDQASVE
jgi:hypothetical protein